MTIRSWTMLAAGAVSCVASPALAQSNVVPSASVRSPTAVYGSVTEADLRALILAEGHTVDAMHPFDQPSVRGKTKAGLVFVLIGTACDSAVVKHCQGIMMQVRYDADDRVTDSGLVDAGIAQAAVSTWWDKPGKTVGFTRYVVLDDGVTWMNIRRNLRVLLAIEPLARKKIWP